MARETVPGGGAIVMRAEGLRRAGRVQEAVAILDALLAQEPRRIGAWVLLARVRTLLGDLAAAGEIHRRILAELDSRNLSSLRALAGEALAGRDPAARDYLERWRREDPEDPELDDLLADPAPAPRTLRLAPGPLDLSLAELERERELIAAPSPADRRAWEAATGRPGPLGGERGRRG